MRYVKYIGPSHIRQITARDWRSVGINADTVVWSAQNGFAVPADHFSDDQMSKAIENDQFLVLTGDDEDFTPQPQARDMTPAQAAQTAENPVDVVAVLEGDQTVSRDESGASKVAPGGAAPTAKGGKSGGGSDAPGTTAH
jgi:hypothetical protein